MEINKTHELLKTFKNWLSSSNPTPQAFLTFRGKNVLRSTDGLVWNTTKDLPVTLQFGRAVVKEACLLVTQDFYKKFDNWSSNYEQYAEYKQIETDNIEIDSVNLGLEDSDTPVFRKPQVTTGEQTSGGCVFKDVVDDFQDSLNNLLNDDGEFKQIRMKLEAFLEYHKNDHPEVYIQYEDLQLTELPLHLWKILQERNIEPVFCHLEDKHKRNVLRQRKKKLNILVVLGNFPELVNLWSEVINLEQAFSDANIKTIIVDDQKQISDDLWIGKWDVLYFAGHSDTDKDTNNGKIYLTGSSGFKGIRKANEKDRLII
jgi:hypothetical protein